ncbi:hypothetical protein BLOT_014527 [Blomia tropicalis]|nr:hypothetical protein BLOT_014527 [Blomia tropicalis]
MVVLVEERNASRCPLAWIEIPGALWTIGTIAMNGESRSVISLISTADDLNITSSLVDGNSWLNSMFTERTNWFSILHLFTDRISNMIVAQYCCCFWDSRYTNRVN